MSWWIWIVVGLACCAAELLTPGGIVMIFFGAAALVVGLMTAAGLGGPFWLQILVFTVLYRTIGHYSWLDSLFNSAMTQTLAGAKMPRQNAAKVIMIVQALVSFLIITHAVVLVSRSAAAAKQRPAGDLVL